MTEVDPKPVRRVLVAAEPAVVEGALAALLEEAGHVEVVQLHEATIELLEGRFDVTITSVELPSGIRSDRTINLDHHPKSGDPAGSTTDAHGGRIDLTSYEDVIDLVAAELDLDRRR